MMMKFPTSTNISELRSNLYESRQCYLMAVSLHKKVRFEASPTDPRDFTKPFLHLELTEPLIKTPLDKACPDWVIKIGLMLFNEKRVQLISFLKKNVEVFTWSPRDV